MIQLDEYHYVASADVVAAIIPMYIPAPVPAGHCDSGKPSIVDPERSLVTLKAGGQMIVERSTHAIAHALKERG